MRHVEHLKQMGKVPPSSLNWFTCTNRDVGQNMQGEADAFDGNPIHGKVGWKDGLGIGCDEEHEASTVFDRAFFQAQSLHGRIPDGPEVVRVSWLRNGRYWDDSEWNGRKKLPGSLHPPQLYFLGHAVREGRPVLVYRKAVRCEPVNRGSICEIFISAAREHV